MIIFTISRKAPPLDKRLGWQFTRSGRREEMKSGWITSFGIWSCFVCVIPDVSIGNEGITFVRNAMTHPSTHRHIPKDTNHQPHGCQNNKSRDRKSPSAVANKPPFFGLPASNLFTIPTELPRFVQAFEKLEKLSSLLKRLGESFI